MKKIDRILQDYNNISNMFLLDCILFSKNIDEILKQSSLIIISKDFLNFFKHQLMIIRNSYNYPEDQIKKAKILLDFIKENSQDLDKELDECYYVLKNITVFSNDKYLDEFHMKKNILNDFKQNECYVWNKDDMDESICFDYIVYISLSAPKDKYCMMYMPKFILSKNYIYAIKKIMYLCPEILKIEQFKKRIEEIIKLDIEQVEDYDADTIKEYIKQNYHSDKNLDFNTKQLEELKREAQHTLYELQNINANPFDLSEFKFLYHLLALEQYIYFEEKLDVTKIDIDVLCAFIADNVKNSLLNNKHRQKLLGILIRKQGDFKSFEEWKKYSDEIDKIEELEDDKLLAKLFGERTDQIDYIRCMYNLFIKNNPSLLFNIINSRQYDLGNFESFVINDKDFEAVKDYLKETNYPISILRFIKEAPSIFMDQTVYDRTMEILNSYDNRYSKKAIKKLEKMIER